MMAIFFSSMLKVSRSWLVLAFSAFLVFSGSAIAGSQTFKVFLSVPDSVLGQDKESLGEFYGKVGIRSVDVVYEPRFLTDEVVDEKKVVQLAQDLRASSADIVVIDAEFGDRFAPHTNLPMKIKILQLLRRSGVGRPVGMYGTYPQVIFKERENYSYYDNLNDKYVGLLGFVDFLSPVLYNYSGRDVGAWRSIASYLVAYAKRNGQGKPVYPFVSPVYWEAPLDTADGRRYVTELSRKEFLDKLMTLKGLGADGCIIWIGSRYKSFDGGSYKVKENAEWLRAVEGFLSN